MKSLRHLVARGLIPVLAIALFVFSGSKGLAQQSSTPTKANSSSGEIMKFTKLTPNLFVHDVAASMKFYQDVLGFQKGMTVPDQAPYVFGSVTSGNIEIFFNDVKAVAAEDPAIGGAKIGGTMTMYIEVEGIENVVKAVEKSGVKINMPLKTQFYGMREFGFIDPEGWMVTIAEREKK